MWSLETPYYGDMLNVGKAEGTGTISMNAAGRWEATLCYFCGDVQCICHHWCNWRGHVYSWAVHSKQLQGIAWSTCIQSVGALRILWESSTRCHHVMWSFGMTYLGDVMHGLGKQSLKHFEQICDNGIQPNDITFVWLLSCRFGGWRPVLLHFTDHSLHNFCKIGTLNLQCWPPLPC